MAKLILLIVMLMGATVTAGQQASRPATAPRDVSSRPETTRPAANTRRSQRSPLLLAAVPVNTPRGDSLGKLRRRIRELNEVLKPIRQNPQPSRRNPPLVNGQDDNVARQGTLGELQQRLAKLTKAPGTLRRGPQAATSEPSRTRNPDEAAKEQTYTKRIKELQDEVLALSDRGNQQPGRQVTPDSTALAEPAAGSSNQANTANQVDSTGAARPQATPSQRYYYLQGKMAHNKGKYPDARNAFQQIDDPGQLGPSDAQNLHLLKAITFRKLKMYQEAAAEYQALLDRLSPSDPLRTTVEWFQLHCVWLARHAPSQEAAQ